MDLDLSRFRILTFDCYGTLIDWETGLLHALRPVMARHGAALEDERLLEIFAELEAEAEAAAFRPYRQVLQQVLRALGERLGFAPAEEEASRFAASVANWPPFPDTVAALRRLGRRYRLGVISNVDDDLFAATALQLQVRFDWVITAQQVGSYKPSRNNFERALERIAVPQEQVLHCAQSLYHDLAPARALGLATVWVNRRAGKSGGGATRAAQAQPDLTVPDLKTLADMAG